MLHNNLECFMCKKTVKGLNMFCSDGCKKEYNSDGDDDNRLNNDEVLFEGELLSVWKEDGQIFITFSYPGVSIAFSDELAIELMIDDILMWAESIKQIGRFNIEPTNDD